MAKLFTSWGSIYDPTFATVARNEPREPKREIKKIVRVNRTIEVDHVNGIIEECCYIWYNDGSSTRDVEKTTYIVG